jgi:hypothetical protein
VAAGGWSAGRTFPVAGGADNYFFDTSQVIDCVGNPTVVFFQGYGKFNAVRGPVRATWPPAKRKKP